MIDAEYLAARCARDWGLYHDVLRNIARCRCVALHTEADGGDVVAKLASLEEALVRRPKPLTWRLRVRLGERVPWRDVVEERDGRYLSSREHTGDGGCADDR